MNHIHHVNIGGYPFIIDEDAHHDLNDYLDILETHFSSHEGAEEIVGDIEARCAELLRERKADSGIISIADVRAVIRILGTPEDLTGSEGHHTTVDDTVYDSYGHDAYDGTRRLFRDPDSKVIGGVCSGITHFLGWKSPVWIRLIWAAFVFIGGSGVLLYLILWAIIPKAKTSADRLAMQGKPVNVNTIAHHIEDSVRDITDTIDDLGDRIKSKTTHKHHEHH